MRHGGPTWLTCETPMEIQIWKWRSMEWEVSAFWPKPVYSDPASTFRPSASRNMQRPRALERCPGAWTTLSSACRTTLSGICTNPVLMMLSAWRYVLPDQQANAQTAR